WGVLEFVGADTEVRPYEYCSIMRRGGIRKGWAMWRDSEMRRRSMRLRGYDYLVPGAYFVTVCGQGRRWLVGGGVEGVMRLSVGGLVVDSYVVMPNHLHGVIVSRASEDGMERAAGDVSLARVVQWFKSGTTADYRRGVETDGWEPFRGRLWQRTYY